MPKSHAESDIDNEEEVDAEEARQHRKAAKRASAVGVDVAATEAKKLKKEAKRVDGEVAVTKVVDTDASIQAEWAAERKRRKAAKRTATRADSNVHKSTGSFGIEEASSKGPKHTSESEDGVRTGAQDADAKVQAEWDAAKRARRAAKRAADRGFSNAYDGTVAVDIEKAPPKQESNTAECEADAAEIEAINEGKRKSKGNKKLEIFVAGLPFSSRIEDVRNYFEDCGEIAAFRMPANSEGKHKGMAFIKFRDDEACCKALHLNAKDYGGRKIIVNRAGDSNAQKDMASAQVDKGSGKSRKAFELFVGGLPFATTEAILKKDFAECGEIVALRMVKNEEGQCKGVAFIEYMDKASCDSALKFDGTDYGGRTLKVRMTGDTAGKDGQGKGEGTDKETQHSQPKGKGKGKRARGNKQFQVFVGGLPFATEEEVLRSDFGECGEVVSLTMPLNDEGGSKGIAFIEYSDKGSCDKALGFNETDYGGRTIYVRLSEHAGGSRPNTEDQKPEAAKAQEVKAANASVPKKFEYDSDDD